MLPDAQSWEAARAAFRWQIPAYYNIGVDVCDRWADTAPERVALIHEDPDGGVAYLTFAALRDASNQAANCLRRHGIAPGDRVAILLGQSPRTAIMHVAVYKSGAIAVPLFSLFGPQALEYRLRDSGARLLLTDAEGAEKIAAIRNDDGVGIQALADFRQQAVGRQAASRIGLGRHQPRVQTFAALMVLCLHDGKPCAVRAVCGGG